jgi:DNA-binding transcriptional ArsR family regulator
MHTMMDNVSNLAQFYKALADDTRLKLVCLLAQQAPGYALCVGSLACRLGVTPSAISQHLRILKSLGLVHAERLGAQVHYYLDEERLAAFRTLELESLSLAMAAPADPNTTMEDDPMCCCKEKSKCCNSEKLKTKPKECSPEQIKECHGDVAEHCCTQETPKKD